MWRLGQGRVLQFKSAASRINPASAADLKFLHRLRRTHFRNFKSKSGTRIICLLVPLLPPKFVSGVPQCITNFGSGALAAWRLQERSGILAVAIHDRIGAHEGERL